MRTVVRGAERRRTMPCTVGVPSAAKRTCSRRPGPGGLDGAGSGGGAEGGDAVPGGGAVRGEGDVRRERGTGRAGWRGEWRRIDEAAAPAGRRVEGADAGHGRRGFGRVSGPVVLGERGRRPTQR